VLELRTEALSDIAEGTIAGASVEHRSETPIRLPVLVPQSVFRDEFSIRVRSLERIRLHRAGERARQGTVAVAAEWRELLCNGSVGNASELARRMGVSRARVSQVLARPSTGDLSNQRPQPTAP
jgi:hypothetical protein